MLYLVCTNLAISELKVLFKLFLRLLGPPDDSAWTCKTKVLVNLVRGIICLSHALCLQNCWSAPTFADSHWHCRHTTSGTDLGRLDQARHKLFMAICQKLNELGLNYSMPTLAGKHGRGTDPDDGGMEEVEYEQADAQGALETQRPFLGNAVSSSKVSGIWTLIIWHILGLPMSQK